MPAFLKTSGIAMVSIRLSRAGAKKRPFYHLVVTDSRNRRDGRYLERLGYFNPVARGQEQKLRIDLERVDYWISQGAKPSSRVASLLRAERKGLPVGRPGRKPKSKAQPKSGDTAEADQGQPEVAAAAAEESVAEPAAPSAEPAQADTSAGDDEPKGAAVATESGEQADTAAPKASSEEPTDR